MIRRTEVDLDLMHNIEAQIEPKNLSPAAIDNLLTVYHDAPVETESAGRALFR